MLGREPDVPGPPAALEALEALEGFSEELAGPASEASVEAPPDPGVAPQARPDADDAAVTPEEYDALRGGWGELDLSDAGDAGGEGGLPPGFADLPSGAPDLPPDQDSLAVPEGATQLGGLDSAEDEDDQLPPGFSSPPSAVDT